MLKYAQIVNEETKACNVSDGTDTEYYESLGMTLQEVEQSYTGEWYLLGYAPQKSLETLKCETIDALWENYKKFQQKRVDAEDLTLATVCAANGSAKGVAVQAWVMRLWAQYYTVKDAVATAETAEALNAIDLTADSFGEPPYTIRELNEEAALAMSN